MRILLTGGAGYIGSHILLQLLRFQHNVLVFDNFSNSSPQALQRVKQLANADFELCQADILNASLLSKAFSSFKPEAVIHLAGLKAVSESNKKPLEYYSQNVAGSIELLKTMERHGCRRLVFSSSATVYGKPEYLPCDENHALNPTNPYGRTKYFVEEIIKDWAAAWQGSSAVVLRYFNPVGADASGQIGEDPMGMPNNLVPYIAQVAVGRRDYLNVYGNDYNTRDGTGERDYIHVEDLASAHLAAIDLTTTNNGCEVINVGTGKSATVLEMVAAFEKASGQKIPYRTAPRREGDVGSSLADVGKAKLLLGWTAKLGIDEMCKTTWHWQSKNPHGYGA